MRTSIFLPQSTTPLRTASTIAKVSRGQQFNFALFREIIAEATELTNAIIPDAKLTSIAPYGFELLTYLPEMEGQTFWPMWPKRHYPAIGYPETMERERAECVVHTFQGIVLERLFCLYPEFHKKLKFVEAHNNGRYTRLKDADLENIADINTMHIELFPLPDGKTILQHYSKYVATLFGAIANKDFVLPELREFKQSKTRRNRFFQQYIMCESLAAAVLQEYSPLSTNEQSDFKLIFQALRTQNPTEYITELPTKNILPTNEEYQIKDRLVIPRMQHISSIMSANNPVALHSPPYYDGVKLLTTHLDEAYVSKILDCVQDSYSSFVETVVAAATQQYSQKKPIN